MANVAPTFLPAIVAAKQRATVRKFQSTGADDAARARSLEELGIRDDRLFGRLVKAGVVVKTADGRYFLSHDGLARWKRNARIGVVLALLAVLVGALIAFGLLAP
jgi:hypothetical protein